MDEKKTPHSRLFRKLMGAQIAFRTGERFMREAMQAFKSLPELRECPKCKGRGWIKDKVLTLRDCPDCDGIGFVELKRKKTEPK